MSIQENGIINELPNSKGLTKGWPFTEETDSHVFDPEITYPKISIVTPSYNQGQFIEETIRSVLLQNYPNLEYIIIDGGSTDNTIEVIKKYEKWITYWVSEPDRGQTHAINKGFERCTGEIFNWLNSDDSLSSGTLFKVAKSFNKTNINAVCGYLDVLDPNNNREKTRSRAIFDKNTAARFLSNYVIAQPATFFRKAMIDDIFPLNEDYHYHMDYDLWLKFLLNSSSSSVEFIDDIVALANFHEECKTYNNNDFSFQEREKIITDVARVTTADSLFFVGKEDIIPCFYTENLFVRNKDGSRKSVNWVALKKSLFRYPVSTIRIFLRKLFKLVF